MSVAVVPERPVHHHVYNPCTSIFKAPANEKAISSVVYCKLESCPLRDAGCCTLRAVLFPDKCPYGHASTETGPTKRAAKFSGWVREREKEAKGVGYLKSAPKKLAFIGEYVYLPYAHVTMCKTVPFLSHSAFIVSGNPFIRRENWAIDTVLKLVDFRPQAMMGGEISSYQTVEVPLFVQHLRELDRGMWDALVAERPGFDIAPNYVGRKARLKTLNHPITIPAKNGQYPVRWEWDGSVLRTGDKDAYSSTWGGLELSSIEVVGSPSDATVVEIKDNSWVNEDTQFVD